MLMGLIFISLAAISWGTTGATMAVLSKDTMISPLFVGWARLAIAAPCLVLVAAATRSRPIGRRPSPPGGAVSRSRAPLSTRRLAAYAVLGLAMASYQVCYFRAVTLTGVAVAALLAICSAPAMIAILAAVALRESVGPVVQVSLIMALAGTALLVVGPRTPAEISGAFGAGALLALGAGLSYAVYAVTAKQVLAHSAPLVAAAGTFCLAAVFLAPALLLNGALVADLRRAAPLLLYLGLGPTAIAYGLFTAGLRRVPATVAGIVTLLEPLTAAVLGVAVLGESLGPLGWTGAALLVAALSLLVATRPGTAR